MSHRQEQSLSHTEEVPLLVSVSGELSLSHRKLWLFTLQRYRDLRFRGRRRGVRDRTFLTTEEIGGAVAMTLSAAESYRILCRLHEVGRRGDSIPNASLIDALEPAFGGVYVTLPAWVMGEMADGETFIKTVTATLQRFALENWLGFRNRGAG